MLRSSPSTSPTSSHGHQSSSPSPRTFLAMISPSISEFHATSLLRRDGKSTSSTAQTPMSSMLNLHHSLSLVTASSQHQLLPHTQPVIPTPPPRLSQEQPSPLLLPPPLPSARPSPLLSMPPQSFGSLSHLRRVLALPQQRRPSLSTTVDSSQSPAMLEDPSQPAELVEFQVSLSHPFTLPSPQPQPQLEVSSQPRPLPSPVLPPPSKSAA